MLDANESYRLIHGDCITEMSNMPEHSMDFCVHSPPFPSVYAYSSSSADIGNSEDTSEAKIHLSFYLNQLVRVMKPSRVVIVHVTQIPNMKRSGSRGMRDFRGTVIRIAQRAGFDYDYDWLVRRNPQAQAIRSKSHQLQFAGLERDRTQSRGAMGDYLIKLLAPGENKVPVNNPNEVSRNNWIDWAECCWRDIRETHTLNVACTKGENDTKHIAPLQLDIIRRCVKLFSNPGEIVFSPFAGIGSEGVVAIEEDRRFVGIELKPEYYTKAVENIDAAIRRRKELKQSWLFDLKD